MLKLVFEGLNLPYSFIRDPSSSFQPGMIAQLDVINNTVQATVSNGTAPIGIIDDIRTKAFTNVSWNEAIKVPAIGVPGPGGVLVTPVPIMKELRRPNILKGSFQSTVNVILNPINGIITFPAGTPLNVDLAGAGQPSGISTIVNYTYFIANIPGDDSTASNGRMTVWLGRGIFQTDQFETNQQYSINSNLYVSEVGLLTSRRPSKFHPCIALTTAPPISLNPSLEFLWL